MNSEIIQLVLDFINIQQNLIIVFRQSFPQITDWKYLLDSPRKGYIDVLGEQWKFEKHGSGICFTGQTSGKIIDVHKGLDSESELLDSWRLTQYFESIDRKDIAKVFDISGDKIISEIQKEILINP